MYIEQGYKGKLGMWKYFIIPVGFMGLMALNYLVITLFDLDVESIMQQEILAKGKNRVLVEMLIPFAIGLLILFGWVKYIHRQSITSLTTSRKKIDWGRIVFAFSLWAIITVVFVMIEVKTSPENFIYNLQWEPFLYLAVIGILLIPLQTSFEEYLFRGYMMQGIGIMAKNRWVPLLVTSVLFGIMHIANPEVGKIGSIILVYYIGTGLFLGILTLMDEGLELALGFHAANNLITALLVTADWTAFQTNSVYKDISPPQVGPDVLIPVLVVFPVLLFIFSKKYKWNGWKEKLTGKIVVPVNETINEIGR